MSCERLSRDDLDVYTPIVSIATNSPAGICGCINAASGSTSLDIGMGLVNRFGTKLSLPRWQPVTQIIQHAVSISFRRRVIMCPRYGLLNVSTLGLDAAPMQLPSEQSLTTQYA
jgi:hypothetical protein